MWEQAWRIATNASTPKTHLEKFSGKIFHSAWFFLSSAAHVVFVTFVMKYKSGAS
jgi:hypothetical protein